jgi:hypothetical protein
VLSDTGHVALAIDAMLADTIIATVAATTTMMLGLAIPARLFFRNNKNVRVWYVISGIKRPRATQAKNKAEVLSTLGLYNRQPMQYIPMLVLCSVSTLHCHSDNFVTVRTCSHFVL